MGKSSSSHDVNNNGWGVLCTSGLNLFAFSVSVTVNVPAAPLSHWRISDTAPWRPVCLWAETGSR